MLVNIKIEKYDKRKNQFEAFVDGKPAIFDPFVSGILNGDIYDAEREALVGSTFMNLDAFKAGDGAWLLTLEGEKQFKALIE